MVTFKAESHRGDIEVFLFSALRGACNNRSGDNARLSNGDLGSPPPPLLLARPKVETAAFLLAAAALLVVGVNNSGEDADGLYD